jgi:demethylmenaquinone methyltransferase / 2-methoxy-6-polyprenyl-1,4-benzoquinol methylase
LQSNERLKNVKRPETEERVQAFFSSVARRYDINNTVISFGFHYSWKRRAVKEVDPQPGDKCVDICSGTNDVAIMLAKKIGPTGHVTAVDWNEEMQAVGDYKIDKQGLTELITNIQGDAEALPLPDNSFDRATVAVASRHLRIPEHFREIYRVLKPGGRAVVLDFFEPPNPLWSKLYFFYSYHILPRLGNLITKDKTGVYSYLPDSVKLYYKPEDFADEMKKAGFKNIKYYPLTGGIVYIHAGDK